VSDDDVAARIDPGLFRSRSRGPATNPFNPGFGTAPPRFAGRNELVAEVIGRIERGPGRYEFHTVIVGPRGVGKTVLLAEILEQGAHRNRWVPIPWNASRPLGQVLAEHRSIVNDAFRGLLRRRLAHVDSVAVKATPGGVGAEARIIPRPGQADLSAYGMLEQYGRVAAARHAVLVIAADELQAASTNDLQELVAALQQLANVQRLPVALVGVGLPATGHLLRRADVSPGFVERLEAIRIDNLDPAATRDALETPFNDAGRDVEPAAVDRMTAATHGYPYAIQVVGHACWEAGGDDPVVTLAAAERACSTLRQVLDTQIFQPRWAAMSPGDRQYLYVAAQLADDHGMVTGAAIAAALGRAPEHVTRQRDRLINQHHVLQPVERGVMQFSVPGFADWVQQHVARLRTEAGPPPPELGPPDERTVDDGRNR
jgi:hypothetical protein